MIFLIEGTDRVGKSTLALHLSTALDIPIVHRGVPPSDPALLLEYFLQPLQQAIETHEHFILDRFHLSNAAYLATFGGAVLPAADWFYLDSFLKDRDTWMFMLVDQPRAIYDRLQIEGKDQLTLDEIGTIQNRFNQAFDRSRISPKGSFKLPQLIDGNSHTIQFRELLRAIHEELDRPWNETLPLPEGVRLGS